MKKPFIDILKKAEFLVNQLPGNRARSNIVVPADASEGLVAAVNNFNKDINSWKPHSLLPYTDSVDQAFNRFRSAINKETKAILSK